MMLPSVFGNLKVKAEISFEKPTNFHGVTTQKNQIEIITPLKTSKFISLVYLLFLDLG
jgi:hypothetical protein